MGTKCRQVKLQKNGYLQLHSNGLLFLKYLVVMIMLSVKNTEAKQKVCRNFEISPERGFFEEKVSKTFSTYCPPSSLPYSIYLVGDDGLDNLESVKGNLTFLVCWNNDVRRFALQFHESVLLDTSTSGPIASVRTCVVTNDTVHYSRRHGKVDSYKLLLKTTTTASNLTFRGYFDTKKKYAHRRHIYTYRYGADERKRDRRSIGETFDVTDASECGLSRSCVRFGSSDCGHFTCDYFLSTNATSKDVDIELSAKSKGWVALGLSSDTKMGGDEVIACHKANPMASTVHAGTFVNPYSHDRARRKDSDVVKLLNFAIEDGYIYCHVTRPMGPKDHQDLSAIWYQLYATGPVSQSGGLEKHLVTPSVSNKMISLVHKYNIIGGGERVFKPSVLTILFVTITLIVFSH